MNCSGTLVGREGGRPRGSRGGGLEGGEKVRTRRARVIDSGGMGGGGEWGEGRGRGCRVRMEGVGKSGGEGRQDVWVEGGGKKRGGPK